jgi:succinate dehydrogenase/fumarate reductase flavoprotein subunit
MEQGIIIIGNSVAALNTAIAIAEKGVHVSLFSRASVQRSASNAIKEGVNAALDSLDAEMSTKVHLFDTVCASEYLFDQELALEMVEAAPRVVNLYDRMGVVFDRGIEGYVKLSYVDGASETRCACAGDYTGQSVVHALSSQILRFVNKGYIKHFEGWEFLSLVKDSDGRVAGIVAQDRCTMEVNSFSAWAVVLATEGFGQIYSRKLSSLASDGAEMFICFSAGANLANLEFTHIGEDEVVTFGGLWVDEKMETSVPGLFAAGECQFQFRGIAPMSGNRILAQTYSGLKAAVCALEYFIGSEQKEIPASIYNDEIEKQKKENEKLLSSNGSENPYLIKNELNDVMSKFVGVEKNAGSLNEASNKIEELLAKYKKCKLLDKGLWMNEELFFVRGLRGTLALAGLVVKSALGRKESRGSHRRSDFAGRDDKNWLCLSKVISDKGELNYDTKIDVEVFSPTKG